VFDIADLIKDAVILPQAFVSAAKGHSEQEFRQACIETLTRTEALDFMIEVVKRTAATVSKMAVSDKAGEA
jgi:CRISPR-associated protein Cas1